MRTGGQERVPARNMGGGGMGGGFNRERRLVGRGDLRLEGRDGGMEGWREGRSERGRER